MKIIRWSFLFFLLILTIFIWQAVLVKTNSPFEIVFLDVGQGDAIYIKAPNGNQMLIDGGRDKSVLRELAKVMPWDDRFIDVVVATHPDADHVGGLVSVADRFQIGAIIESGTTAETVVYKNLETKINNKQIPKVLAKSGMKIFLDNDTIFTVLFPDSDRTFKDTNESSIVGRLIYGNQSFLLNGDAPIKTENWLLAHYLPSDLQTTVLKAGHHGSKTSTSQKFLETINPKYVVVSAGENNQYGHPHQEVVSRARQFGANILSTAESGAVSFIVRSEE